MELKELHDPTWDLDHNMNPFNGIERRAYSCRPPETTHITWIHSMELKEEDERCKFKQGWWTESIQWNWKSRRPPGLESWGSGIHSMELKELLLELSLPSLPLFQLESIQWNWKQPSYRTPPPWPSTPPRIHSMELKARVAENVTENRQDRQESIQWNWKLDYQLALQVLTELGIHSMELKG